MIINQLKTTLLLAGLAGIMLVIGFLVGGTNGLTIALIIAILFNFISYWFSDKIVLKMYRAKEITENSHPNFYRIVKEVAYLGGVPMPKVFIIPTNSPNAFATGRNPKNAAVACTQGILDLLSKDELRGVIAHEISHIKNRDILVQTIAATIAAVISYAAFMARWAAIFGGMGRDNNGRGLELLFLAILAPIVAVILQLAISRSREYLADETGAKTIHNPLALASALEKLNGNIKKNPLRFGNPSTSSLFIMNPFSARGLMSLFSTHPPFEERVKRLKKMN